MCYRFWSVFLGMQHWQSIIKWQCFGLEFLALLYLWVLEIYAWFVSLCPFSTPFSLWLLFSLRSYQVSTFGLFRTLNLMIKWWGPSGDRTRTSPYLLDHFKSLHLHCSFLVQALDKHTRTHRHTRKNCSGGSSTSLIIWQNKSKRRHMSPSKTHFIGRFFDRFSISSARGGEGAGPTK